MNRNARESYDVLAEIVAAKRGEIAGLRARAAELRDRAESAPPAAAFEAALAAGPGVAVIAEVKRRSPSAGAIRPAAAAADVAAMYEEAGAAAVSVLTDAGFFGGSLSDLEAVRERVAVPLLRKDFTLADVQVHEARAAGAAAVLLIVRILDDAQLVDLGALARELGMGALVEVHDEWELERALKAEARIVGINNRDLAVFTTDPGVTVRLAGSVPADVLLVAESGIREVPDVELLAAAGADAVLVGEALMRADEPGALLAAFAAVPRVGRR